MISEKIIRTDFKNIDFKNLVVALDQDLAVRDGEDHAFYHQYNSIENLEHCIVIYIDNEAVACGAIKAYDKQTVEVKRVFVKPENRGNGYAMKILKALENWTLELGCEFCILETGLQQPEAIALYKKLNYKIIENYGQYKDVASSVCFMKAL